MVQEISSKTPYLADLKPSGRYLMADLHNVRAPDCVCSEHTCTCITMLSALLLVLLLV